MTSPRKFPRTARVNEVMLEVLADELELDAVARALVFLWETGTLTYEDWTSNAMDCWVAQLGVRTELELKIASAPS